MPIPRLMTIAPTSLVQSQAIGYLKRVRSYAAAARGVPSTVLAAKEEAPFTTFVLTIMSSRLF